MDLGKSGLSEVRLAKKLIPVFLFFYYISAVFVVVNVFGYLGVFVSTHLLSSFIYCLTMDIFLITSTNSSVTF